MLFAEGNPYRKGLPDVLHLDRSDFQCGISISNLEAVGKQARWNVFTYMAADDPVLSASMFDDLLEMKSVGSNDDMHVCAMFFGPLLTDTFFARLNTSSSFADDIIFRFFQAGANPKTLVESIRNNAVIFPAGKRILILSGHGNGWQGLLPSLQTWRRYLEQGIALPEGKVEPNLMKLHEHYQNTLDAIRARFQPDQDYQGSPFDVVAFDACKMANIEALVLYANRTPLIVASEAPEPGTGYPYDLILKGLAGNPGMTPGELADHVVASVAVFYKSHGDPRLQNLLTQAVFDGRRLPDICEKIGSLAMALISAMDENTFPVIKKSFHDAFSFKGGYTDLAGLAMNLAENMISREVMHHAGSLADHYFHSGLIRRREVAGGKHLPNGLSIYAPSPEEFSPDYLNLLPSLPDGFRKWTLFLAVYYSWLSGREPAKNPLLPFLAGVIGNAGGKDKLGQREP